MHQRCRGIKRDKEADRLAKYKKFSKQFYWWTQACQDVSAGNPSQLEPEEFIWETKSERKLSSSESVFVCLVKKSYVKFSKSN